MVHFAYLAKVFLEILKSVVKIGDLDPISLSPERLSGSAHGMSNVQSPQRFNCKFGNFAGILFSRMALKRHICDVKNSRQRHDLPLSVNDRVISIFHEGFIFTKLRIFREKKSSRKFPNLQYMITVRTG